jgi:quercetin dioxygenase-like cupin family protein
MDADSFSVFDTASVEGRRKPVARELGARAIRPNQFDSQPGQAGFEHDERESGQEEIYVPLSGSGILWVDGDEIPLGPVRYVLVPPEATRQVVAGPDGLSYAVVGARVE